MTPELLQQEYAKFERSYTQSTAATGPAKWEKLNDFRNGAFAALQQDVQQRVNQAKQQELAAERQKAQEAQRQAQQASHMLVVCNSSNNRQVRCLLLVTIATTGKSDACCLHCHSLPGCAVLIPALFQRRNCP